MKKDELRDLLAWVLLSFGIANVAIVIFRFYEKVLEVYERSASGADMPFGNNNSLIYSITIALTFLFTAISLVYGKKWRYWAAIIFLCITIYQFYQLWRFDLATLQAAGLTRFPAGHNETLWFARFGFWDTTLLFITITLTFYTIIKIIKSKISTHHLGKILTEII